MTTRPTLTTRRLLALGVVTAVLGTLPTATPSAAAAPGARATAPGASPTDDVTAGLLLRYDLTQAAGTTVVDASGNGRDGTLVGGGTWGGAEGLALDGVDDHVKLPNNLTAGLASITVSADVYVDPTQAGNYFIWGLGNPAVGSPASGSGYLMATGNTFRATITNTWWNNEKNTAPSPARNLARGVWKNVIYTQTGTTGTLYEDGVQVGQNTNVTVLPSAIGGGVTTNNVLGESNYAADNTLKGKLKDFRVYDRALTAAEVTDLAAFDAEVPVSDDQTKADEAAAALALVHPDDVRGHLTLPTSGLHSSTVSWTSSAPAVVGTTGQVTRPAHGTGDTSATLTATVTVGSATATRAFPLTVREAPEHQPYAGYAFSYFVNNSIAGEKIYFAASRGNNALQWDELNDGEPVLESTFGEMGLRDPFLIRSPEGDRFFLIATDLSIGRNGDWDRAQRQGSRYLEVWESTDLVSWSDQRHVLVSPATAGNTWAPEAYWDEDLQQFVVFWASKIYAAGDTGHTGATYNRMLYATTRDFVTFSEPQTWQDIGSSRIDSTVIREGDTYYRFTKDEGAGTTGCSDIIQEKNDVLTEPDLVGAKAWEFQAGCIGRDAGTSAVEGPSVFKANPGDVSGNDYYLFVDEYGGRGYIPLGTDDLEAPDWTVPSSFTLPSSPRHGTVMPVTAAELAALRDGLGAPEVPTPVEADENGLVAHYPLTTDAADTSGHGYDGTVAGDASFTDGALTLGGTNGHVRLPDDMMAGLDAITVSTEVWLDPTQATPYFIWGLGNTDSSGAGKGYLFTTGNAAYRSSIASGNWTTEQTATSGAALGRGAWKTLTYTLEDGTATLYLDGQVVGTKTGVTITPGSIGAGSTEANYIGRSVYTADKYLEGKVRDFRIYNRALDGDEVADLAADPTGIVRVDLASLKAPAVIDAAAGTIVLPLTPGTDVTALDPTYVVKAGSSVAPDAPADYSSPVDVTVTGADSTTRTWTVTAVEMRSPVLPGLYADPNIAEFDGTFYLYATTDGTAGWGGKDFYVWTSENLVDWERSAEPILTLDGANGDVPWASGNAWAPTIAEKGGTYYFYFSGHHTALNRKTIGVAVADSPTGPFTAQPEAMILNNEAVTSGQAIDPAAFEDPATGKHYLFWGNGSPVYAELADDMTSLVPGSIKAISGLTSFREGSFVNFRDGTYHLTYSIDDTGSENYRVGYATSTSIDGPWTYRGVILEKDPSQGILATGHSSILNVAGTDDWYIAYHRFAMPGGDGTHRETTIDRLTFGPDGLMQVVAPTLTSVTPLVTTDPAPVSTGAPVVTGRAVFGRTLRATTGAWDQSSLTYVVQWRRDGGPIAGATGASYVLKAADVGTRMSVSVTATNADAASGSALSAPTTKVAKAPAGLRLKASQSGRSTRLTIGLAAGGPVKVKVDGKAVRTVTVRGTKVVTLTLTPGRHTLTVSYAGSATHLAASATTKVTVPKRR